jgi:hypothetical protein
MGIEVVRRPWVGIGNRRARGVAGVLLGVLATGVLAQSAGGPYTLRIEAIASGGEVSAGGPYALRSTLGQPAVAVLSSGPYRVFGGFHRPRTVGFDHLFCDGFEAVTCN